MASPSGKTESGLATFLKPLSDVQERFKEGSMKRLDSMYDNILASPMMVVVLLILIAGAFGSHGLDFQEQIDDDVEIFLPDGAPSTELLLEVREEWSTDIAVIYIQTPNAMDPSFTTNITDEQFLKEMSWVEGDDDNANGDRTGRGIDYAKEDHGRSDGVLSVSYTHLTLPTILLV